MLICDLCGSVSVWTGLTRASCSICPLLADLSGELASSLQPLTFLLHSVSAPVSLFLFSSSPPPLLQKQPTALFLIVLQLSFLYKSFFSTSTCPCRRAQHVPSSCTAMRHCRSVHCVTDSSSVTARQGRRDKQLLSRSQRQHQQAAQCGQSEQGFKQDDGSGRL